MKIKPGNFVKIISAVEGESCLKVGNIYKVLTIQKCSSIGSECLTSCESNYWNINDKCRNLQMQIGIVCRASGKTICASCER